MSAPVDLQRTDSLCDSSGIGSELDRFDAVIRALIARAEPIHFGIVQSAAELTEVYRLRYQTVISRGWASAVNFPDGLEHDADDARAIHIAGWHDTTLVATARLILPATGRLPTEEVFGIEIAPRGQAVNVDRVAVAPGCTGHRHRVFLGLLGQVWLEARRHGYSRWMGIETPGMFRLYRILGFETKALAAPQPFWAEERIPALFDGPTAAPAFLARWGHLLNSPSAGSDR